MTDHIQVDMRHVNEGLLSRLMNRPVSQLVFPEHLEAPFKHLAREQASDILSKSIYGLITIYLAVIIPIAIISEDAGLSVWRNTVMWPIAAVLFGIWVCTRMPNMRQKVEYVLGASVFITLTGTIYCSIQLGASPFGQLASFEVIYILIIAFSILRLPAYTALACSCSAFLIALGYAAGQQLPLDWLHMLLFFIVPTAVCFVTGYTFEVWGRQNFLKNLLLNLESRRLEELHLQSEKEGRKQHCYNEYLELIAGNLSPHELFTHTLSFMVNVTDSQIAAAYRATEQGTLTLMATWGGDPSKVRQAAEIIPDENLLGAAMKQNRTLKINSLPEGYLNIRTGTASLTPAEVMILPVYHGQQAIAAIELAKLQPYTEEQQQQVEMILNSLAYATIAADARAELTAVKAPVVLAASS
ncbi:MAG: GAF domain-containing protein [Gammaproteobacteria bacterium]|jgi:hypothetical protein|nr:GAF domain-containing protein [Gammaproteobacteria bacterium]MBQ0775165.1 GAF domain-containing protein [Gammaproteobacteria bacterium]